MKFIFIVFTIIFLSNSVNSIIDENKFIKVAESIKPYIVYIKIYITFESEGKITQETIERNGLIIDNKGYILTSYISSEITPNIKVFINKKEYSVKLVGSDKVTRISLLKIEDREGLFDLPKNNIKFVSKPVEQGQWLVGICTLSEKYQFEKVVQYCMVATKLPSGLSDLLYITPNISFDGMVLSNMNSEICAIMLPFYELNLSMTETKKQKIRKEIEMMHAELKCVDIYPIISSINRIIKKQGNLDISWIGVSIKELSKSQAEGFGISHNGVLITNVFSDSPAKRAGLCPEDVVFGIDNKLIPEDEIGIKLFIDIIRNTDPDTELVFKILRNKIEKNIVVKTIKYPEPLQIRNSWLGITFGEVNDALYNSLNLFSNKGILIVDIESGTPASYAKLNRSDLITHIQLKEVTNINELQIILNDLKYKKVKSIIIRLYRGNKTLTRIINPELGAKR